MFKRKNIGGKEYILDPVRKKYVILTPEEWVRQQMIVYMKNVLQYPTGVVAVEKAIDIKGVKKRFDILVYKNAKAWLVVECKNENTSIDDMAIQQILSYQTVLQARYLCVSNGKRTICCDTLTHSIQNTLPEYENE